MVRYLLFIKVQCGNSVSIEQGCAVASKRLVSRNMSTIFDGGQEESDAA
jgi:hypothetical protein